MLTMDRRNVVKGMGMMAAAMIAPTMRAEDSKAAFELRVYHTFEGKLDDLLARFRNHTIGLFTKHGIVSVAYWVPTDEGPLKARTLFYIVKYPSRDVAAAMWKTFSTDPEWATVQTASELNGKLVEKVDSTFLELTNFSPRL
jgi:hypothetical protein